MADTLPRWDVSDVFPSIGSPAYAAAREAFDADVTRLTALYDSHDVRGGEKVLDDAGVAAFEEIVQATNAVQDAAKRLGTYINAFVTTDARDDAAQAELSRLQTAYAQLGRLRSRFDAWVAALGADALVARSPVAADHAYPLARSVERADHQMTEDEEGLYADLALTGSNAWQRLYGTFASQLEVVVRLDNGSTETVPMSAARGMAYSPDAARRRAAYEAELATWEANAVPIVAALNAIKGETSLVNRRRGWADDLEPALAANGVDRPTLDAMHAAVEASLPDFRRYLRRKAQLLGHENGLPFHDLFAPMGATAGRSWEDAVSSVDDAFASYSDDLAGLARRAVAERWIDAEPRTGKRDGAFCAGLEGDRSLVLLNFDGSFRGVQTLAHELGHAYHNVTLAHRTALQRQLPMALAETASIFCETIMIELGLASTDGDARLAILEGDLQSACQVVVDIHSRFLFESAFFRARARTTLSVADTCALMLDAQDASYGEGLDRDRRHPFMWAAKPHYYGSTFYNWPYTFGLLFGLGLYARYREDPERFRGSYDDLLSSCGLGTARSLAGRFGIDVGDEAFWTSSLDVLRARIDEFEALTAPAVAS